MNDHRPSPMFREGVRFCIGRSRDGTWEAVVGNKAAGQPSREMKGFVATSLAYAWVTKTVDEMYFQ